MKKFLLSCMVMLLFVVLSISQQVAESKDQDVGVPDNVRISLDALLKTRTSNGVFNLAFIEAFYFAIQTAPQKVYSSVLISAELDKDARESKQKVEEKKKKVMDEYNQFVENKLKELEEENKKIAAENKGKQEGKKRPLKTWEKPPAPEIPVPSSFHNLYLRVVKEGNIIQRFKSPVPFDEKETEYYSLGLILEPGKYDILVNIDRYDNSSDGTLLIELNVPKLTLMDLVSPLGQLEYSRPVFYREMMKSRIVEKRFTILKNKYQVGQQLFFPIIGKEIQFRINESPTLTFFIKGAAKVENNQPQWNVSTQMEIRQGKKKILIFKVPSSNTPYFFQKLEFKKGNNFLPAGDYLLFVGLSDNNQAGKKAKIEIPFKLIE